VARPLTRSGTWRANPRPAKNVKAYSSHSKNQPCKLTSELSCLPVVSTRNVFCPSAFTHLARAAAAPRPGPAEPCLGCHRGSDSPKRSLPDHDIRPSQPAIIGGNILPSANADMATISIAFYNKQPTA
jgi:hypothetical protein